MAYYRSVNPSPPGSNPKISDPTIKSRLETLLANPLVQKATSTADFMKNLLNQFNQRGALSQKQVDCITRTETQFDSAKSALADQDYQVWCKEYDEEKRAKAIKIAQWNKKSFETGIAQAYYHSAIAEKVLNNPNYIPSRQSYEKMVNNPFAQRYLKNSEAPCKFVPADIVRLSTAGAAKFGYKFPHGNGLVINIEPPKKNIAGGHIVTVLPTGTDAMIDIEERWLLKDRT
jgi:hypothetical protein